MQKYQDVVLKPDGSVIQGASVLVQSYPGAITSTIYSDDGVTVQANPMTTDRLGRFAFYAAGGQYQLVVSGNNIATQTITDILLEDGISSGTWTPADGSAAALAFTDVSGQYVKVGRAVFIQGTLTYPVTASGSLSSIVGLPFGQSSGIANGSLVIGRSDQGAGYYLDVAGNGSSTAVNPRDLTGARLINLALSGKLIQFSGWYMTDLA